MKIEALSDAGETNRDEIVGLALEHHLVTTFTSLVAVDRTPTRPDGARLSRADLPLNLPAGWEFDKVFGGERSPAPVMRRADDGAMPILKIATAPASNGGKLGPSQAFVAKQGVDLPKTATDAELRLLAGLAMCVTSLSLMLLVRRRRPAAASS